MPKTTISVLKADAGSFPGHSRTHPKLLEKAAQMLKAEEGTLITDSFVTHCGDALELIMTHTRGVENEEIHRLAGDVFRECTTIAKSLRLSGAGEGMPAGASPGNAIDLCLGAAEMEFGERDSDPVMVFMADKAESGAWNFYLYKIFADPFNTPGLVIDPSLHEGFVFEVHDLAGKQKALFTCPEECYSLLAYIGAPSRYVVRRVFRKDGTIAASTSTTSPGRMAGRNGETDDPVMIVRAQGVFPSMGEVIEPFTIPVLVAGWMRGSHYGPLMPVGLCDASCTRFDGPPRVICFGFQVTNGTLIGPADIFDDPGFDRARARCNELADTIRAQGPFEPHRLSLSEMEHTTLPAVEKSLGKRWEPLGK